MINKMKLGHKVLLLSVMFFLSLEMAMANFGEPLTNGDFSNPLGVGWTDYESLDDVVSINHNNQAVLGESWDVGQTYLLQEFTLPGNALSISFDYQPLFEADGAETFTASLLDPYNTALIPTDADSYDDSESYFFMHDWDDNYGYDEVIYDSTYVSWVDLNTGWYSVTLDLASLGSVDSDAILAFDFIPWFGDYSVDGQILIDNVYCTLSPSPGPDTTVVPVPSSILLGIVGIGSIRAIRRRYKGLFDTNR